MEQTKTSLTVRGHRTEEQMFRLIAERGASNQTVKTFCELHDLTLSIYYYWQKKYQAKDKLSAMKQSGFTLLEVPGTPATVSGLFAEVNGIKLYQPVPAGYLKELIR